MAGYTPAGAQGPGADGSEMTRRCDVCGQVLDDRAAYFYNAANGCFCAGCYRRGRFHPGLDPRVFGRYTVQHIGRAVAFNAQMGGLRDAMRPDRVAGGLYVDTQRRQWFCAYPVKDLYSGAISPGELDGGPAVYTFLWAQSLL